MRKLSAKQIAIVNQASEAAIQLVRFGWGFYSSAVDWCGHKIEGYAPRLYEGNRKEGSFLSDKYLDYVYEEMAETWNAFILVQTIYRQEQDVVRHLRLATSAPVGLDFGFHMEYSQSCFESAYRFGITACQFMPDVGSTNGDFWQVYPGSGLPFTIQGVRRRGPEMLTNYVQFYGIPSNLRDLTDRRVPPWLEIAKEAQRATGQLLPSMARVYGNPGGEASRRRRLNDSTNAAINCFREGLGVDAVCERLGITAENARTIRSRYSDLISES